MQRLVVGSFLFEVLNDSQQLGMHLAERHEERLDGGVGSDASTSRRIRLHPVDEHFQARFEMPQERLRLDCKKKERRKEEKRKRKKKKEKNLDWKIPFCVIRES